MNWWQTVLFSAAITAVFVKGSLFSGLRARGPALWREWASCALCVGVWVGTAAAVMSCYYSRVSVDLLSVFAALGQGCVAGAAALLFERVVGLLEAWEVVADVRVQNARNAGRRP